MTTSEHPAPPPSPKAYHHGSLRAALLEAAWAIVAEDGVEALTMRACARRAGVSHAAPIHHFENLAGLQAELAAVGYDRLTEAMVDAQRSDAGERDVLKAAGIGYVQFAVTFPEHFRLMSRISVTDTRSDRLRDARNAAWLHLVDALRVVYREANGTEPREDSLAARTALAWSCVHGYAGLWVDGSVGKFDLPDADRVLTQLRLALMTP